MLFRLTLCVAMFAAASCAQVTGSVGGQTFPTGCPVPVTITNDTASTVFSNACYWTVTDAVTGASVYNPLVCIAIVIPISPGQVLTTDWPQVDDFGSPVPPGTYDIHIQLPGGGTTTEQIVLGSGSGVISPLGALRPGSARSFDVCFPNEAGSIYFVAASVTATTGIPFCAGVFPLDFDFLLNLSLNQQVFTNAFGVLNGAGRSTQTSLTVPNVAGFSGFTFNVSGITIDFAAGPCAVTAIANVTQVMIL